jgi:hypothetical protein
MGLCFKGAVLRNNKLFYWSLWKWNSSYSIVIQDSLIFSCNISIDIPNKIEYAFLVSSLSPEWLAWVTFYSHIMAEKLSDLSSCLFESFLNWILLSSRKWHNVVSTSTFRVEKKLKTEAEGSWTLVLVYQNTRRHSSLQSHRRDNLGSRQACTGPGEL